MLGGVKFDLFIDHQPLVWLPTQLNSTRKTSLWLLHLQTIDMNLKYILDSKNTADALSRAMHQQVGNLPSITAAHFDHVMSGFDHERADFISALTVITCDC